MGTELKKILENNKEYGFKTFYVIVAYVKSSGVKHLKDQINAFKATNGYTKAVVGIDQKNTSYQGLKLMLSLFDEIYIFHNDKPINTFHPKVYVFEKKNKKAILFTGSSNFTEGGLFTNYETNFCLELNLLKNTHKKIFSEFKQTFHNYSKTENISQKLTKKLLERLKENNYLFDETDTQFAKSIKSSSTKKYDKLFGNENIKTPTNNIKITKKEHSIRINGTFTKPTDFILVWKKENLPRSDAQQVQAGTAYTGNLKLTKADWSIDGNIIDQTRYFRKLVFNNLMWRKIRDKPFVESAQAEFHIVLLGIYIGVKKLKIRHKPSGESGQHNYTTYISWGSIQQEIIRRNITGRTLLLYSSKDKTKFCIDVN